MVEFDGMQFQKLSKLKRGDKVAVLSPSFAGPAVFPKVFELGLQRLSSEFGLIPVEYTTTRKLGASQEERANDLISAFTDSEIKAVFSSIGGDDQVTYVKNLPSKSFVENPKPFFGYSDNTHFMNFLWKNGIPSYYGGSIMTQLAMQIRMDDYTIEHLNYALFETGTKQLEASKLFNEIGLDWADDSNLNKKREYHENTGWKWSDGESRKGILWGGCLESIDEMLRHGIGLPSLKDFKEVILISETSEAIPDADYVRRVYRALGERGILSRIQGVLIGRPKAWEFNKQLQESDRTEHRKNQRATIQKTVREYNKSVPIVQNLDFGHTDPQIPMPLGHLCEINTSNKNITVEF